jgi:hypothetical protein
MLNAISAVLLFAVGYFFFRSLISDKDEYRARMEAARKKAEQRAAERAKAKKQVSPEAMHQCAVCEAYIPASGTTNCGREDCPY